MNVLLAWTLGGTEIVLLVLVVLILFGAKKIPELAKGMGQGIKEFKKATREVTDEIQNAADDKPDKSAAQNKSATDHQSPPAQTVSQTPAPPKA